MKKISFSNLLKALLLIVIGLVYAGQVSAEEPLPTADEIFIGLYDTHDYSGDALVYNNCWHMDTCTHFVGSDSVQPPSFACATEGDRYLRVVSECYSGLDETQRYIRGYGYIYTVNWDNDPLDCACQSPSNVWVDSATSCVSIGCNGGKCCGDDGSGDFWCGAGYTACESGTYYSGGDDNYLACECGKPLLQGSCNSPGETGCWDPGGGKCCGDDGVNDNWCTGMPNEGCVGGYFAYNQDNHPFLCENCGGNAWVASGSGINSRCCGDDIDDNWCGSVSSTTSKACNSGYYVNMDNEDDIAACLCALGYSDPSSADYGCGLTYSDCFYYEATSGCCGDDGVGELECYGTSDGCIDGNFYDDLDTQQTLCADCANGGWSSTATGTNTPCCGDDGASDSWCGTEDACFSGVYQSGGEAGCGCLIYGDQATDTCSVNGQTDCWDGVGCCYDVTSNWCTGIDDTYACHEGVWYNEPSSDSAACNCNSGRVWDDDNCQISGDGTEDCWANNSLDCCYGSNDKWCDGTAGA